MNLSLSSALLFVLLMFSTTTVWAQDDSGLPIRIGGNRCDSAPTGATSTIRGSFNVTGVQNRDQTPKFSIALYAGGGYVTRQRVKNGSTFYFYCVPDRDVYLVAEVDMTEIGTFSMGSLNKPPQINYQDIYVNWSAARDAIVNRNEVISARNSYQRTKENQKLFEKAIGQIRENNGETSAKMLNELISRDPNDFVALTELGNIYCENKRFADAEPLYKHAAELKPDFVNAWFGLGRADLALKNVSDAIVALTAAYKITPDSADVNHFIGEAYLQNKQGTLAIKYMRRAIELSPMEKADLHLRIAWLYNAAGAKNLAAEEYKMLLEKKPNHPDRQKMLDYIAANSAN
jgi:predicted Zn-dependent protease